MTLADDVDLEEYIMAKDDLSGADIKVRINYCILYMCSVIAVDIHVTVS